MPDVVEELIEEMPGGEARRARLHQGRLCQEKMRAADSPCAQRSPAGSFLLRYAVACVCLRRAHFLLVALACLVLSPARPVGAELEAPRKWGYQRSTVGGTRAPDAVRAVMQLRGSGGGDMVKCRFQLRAQHTVPGGLHVFLAVLCVRVFVRERERECA